MEIRHYLQMLRKGWWIVLLTALISLNVAFLAAYFTVPTFSASTKFTVSPNPSVVTEYDVVSSLEALDKRSIVATYGEFLNSRRIYLDAIHALGLDETIMEDYALTAVVLPEANILELSVTGPDPQRAADIANMVGALAIDYVTQLYRAYDISVLDPAVANPLPISPQPVRDAGLALALGLIAGISLAIVSEQVRIPLDAYRNRLRMDTATGVFNRQYFMRLLEDELSQNPDKVASLGFVELTGLQDLNATLPPSAVNWLLVRVTDMLKRELRGNDAIARWNESTFSVLLPLTSGVAANRTFERIFQSLSQPIELGQYGITLDPDPHIGGAVYSNYISTKELISQAESALSASRQLNVDAIRIWEMKNPFWVENQPQAD